MRTWLIDVRSSLDGLGGVNGARFGSMFSH